MDTLFPDRERIERIQAAIGAKGPRETDRAIDTLLKLYPNEP